MLYTAVIGSEPCAILTFSLVCAGCYSNDSLKAEAVGSQAEMEENEMFLLITWCCTAGLVWGGADRQDAPPAWSMFSYATKPAHVLYVWCELHLVSNITGIKSKCLKSDQTSDLNGFIKVQYKSYFRPHGCILNQIGKNPISWLSAVHKHHMSELQLDMHTDQIWIQFEHTVV